MRRLLLVGLLTASWGVALWSSASAPALTTAGARVPRGVTRAGIVLAIPAQAGHPARSVRRTFTRGMDLNELVASADSLQRAVMRGACPMIIRLGPTLTVTFRTGRKPPWKTAATLSVQVTLGSHGASGSSACFPIHFSARGVSQALVGNSFVRLVGRLINTPIS